MHVSVYLAATVAAATLAAQTPPRDPAQRQEAKGTSSLTGQIYALDTGKPMKRAAVRVTSPSLREGRAAVTDAEGRYAIDELPAGRYTITASRAGYVALSYGQRVPLGPPTPVTLKNGERLVIDLKLPRGAVIAGRVFDEDGEPVVGSNVRVQRLQYERGERQLVPVGGDQSDDRGAYRVFGLTPGEYVVSATVQDAWLRERVQRVIAGAAPGGPGAAGGRGVGPGGGVGRAAMVNADVDSTEEGEALAPTYHPGTVTAHDAGRVTVGLSAELDAVDIHLQLVRTSLVSGTLVGPPEGFARGMVTVLPEGRGREALRLGSFSGPVGPDGTFAIRRVPPGRYVLAARAMAAGGSQALFASEPLTLAGQNVTAVSLMLTPGATLTGNVEVRGGATPSASVLRSIRIGVLPQEAIPLGGNVNSRVESDGSFSVDGIPAGRYFVRPTNLPRGFALSAVSVNGFDMTDATVDVAGGRTQSDVRIILTDRLTRISGVVRDDMNQPAPFATVVAFAADSTRWGPASRFVHAVQPDQSGAFELAGLPPATYLLVAVDVVEQGEWLDSGFLDRIRALGEPITIAEGELKAQDLKVKTRS